MEEHYRVINDCVAKISSARNSKVLSKERYDKIVSQLCENSSSDPNAKFRWWVKDKGYKLFNFPEIGLTDVLCIPAKNQVIIYFFLALLILRLSLLYLFLVKISIRCKHLQRENGKKSDCLIRTGIASVEVQTKLKYIKH